MMAYLYADDETKKLLEYFSCITGREVKLMSSSGHYDGPNSKSTKGNSKGLDVFDKFIGPRIKDITYAIHKAF